MVVGDGDMTYEENQVHFGGWCIVSSPLILAFNLSDVTRRELVWDIITNKEAIQVNQVGCPFHLKWLPLYFFIFLGGGSFVCGIKSNRAPVSCLRAPRRSCVGCLGTQSASSRAESDRLWVVWDVHLRRLGRGIQAARSSLGWGTIRRLRSGQSRLEVPGLPSLSSTRPTKKTLPFLLLLLVVYLRLANIPMAQSRPEDSVTRSRAACLAVQSHAWRRAIPPARRNDGC